MGLERRDASDDIAVIATRLSPEPTMSKSLIQRGLSLSLAALVTLAMLGGIDQLSQGDEPVPQWAQQTSVRA